MTDEAVDVTSGLVIRPGDRLVVTVPVGTTNETGKRIRDTMLARLPDVADVIVVTATAVSVMRDEP